MIFANLFGGRPMKREGLAFVDKVSGASVNYYTDRLGRRWMAENAWSLFRVPVAPSSKGAQAATTTGDTTDG